MKKRYLTTPEEVIALKDTDTKIYSESYPDGYYKFVEGVLCSFYQNKWSNINSLIESCEVIYILEEEPEQEATEDDVNKLCLFWDDEDDKNAEIIGVLKLVINATPPYARKGGGFFFHCRPLTEEEIKEFMEKAE